MTKTSHLKSAHVLIKYTEIVNRIGKCTVWSNSQLTNKLTIKIHKT